MNGVDQFGESNLVGEEIDLETLANRHAFSALFGAEILGRAFLARIRAPASTPDVRNDLDRGWNVGVVDFVLFALSGGPNELVPVGGHDVEHHQFVLKDLGIGLVVDEAANLERPPQTSFPSVARSGCANASFFATRLLLIFHGGRSWHRFAFSARLGQ